MSGITTDMALGYVYSHGIAKAAKDAQMELRQAGHDLILGGTIAQLGHWTALVATADGGDETTLVEALMDRLDTILGDLPLQFQFRMRGVILDEDAVKDALSDR